MTKLFSPSNLDFCVFFNCVSYLENMQIQAPNDQQKYKENKFILVSLETMRPFDSQWASVRNVGTLTIAMKYLRFI